MAEKPMEKYGAIPADAACETCGGKGCPTCEGTGRKYKCHICKKWRCEHLGDEPAKQEDPNG